MTNRRLLPTRSLRSQVRAFIVEHGLIRPGERVLVGVSGGPDSTALLLLLAALRKPLDFDLQAAHFDHQLRGSKSAARELRFVEDLACELDVPLHAGSGDVRTRSKRMRESIEEAARELRYRFLAHTATETGCSTVAVGHTLDDQAETVLLHLVRGSGLRGLAGMSPASDWPVRVTPAPRLVRPLLAVSREQTAACCSRAGLQAVDDPANRSLEHMRSRIRHQLVPLLRDLNPRVDAAIARLASAAAEDVKALEALAASAVRKSSADEKVRIDRKRLAELPGSLQHHAIRIAFQQVLGEARGLGERHVRAIVAANAGGSGTQLDLPRNVHARVERAAIVLSSTPSSSRPLPRRSAPVTIPGRSSLGPWEIQAEVLQRRPKALSSDDGLLAVLDADQCRNLRLRRRREGDRFQPLGMRSPKKLQDFFVDMHVPRNERDSIPLLVSDRGIAWVVGHRPAEWARVTPGTRRFLRLRAHS